MKILSQISEVDQELTKVLSGESNILAIKSLDIVFDRIVPTCDAVKVSAEKRLACNNLTAGFAIAGLTSEELVLAQSALSEVEVFVSRWEELEEKHSIIQEDTCSNTKETIASFIKALDDRTKSGYNGWQNQILSEVHISDADLELQENSPDLKENAKNYQELHVLFVQKLESNPLTEEAIVDLKNRHVKLIELKGKMEFDYPEDVIKLFQQLRRIGNQGRAPVRMLTKEVWEWMEESEQTSHFYIIDARIGSYRR